MNQIITGQAAVTKLLNGTNLSPDIIARFLKKINDDEKLSQFFEAYYAVQDEQPQTPLFVYNARQDLTDIFIVDRREQTPEPGEQGSILGIVRGFGMGEEYLYSDCYGQLSCSSCAIEVLAGKPENAKPREEEYDMLDIDESKPPTQFTRLGCQTKIGTDPLVIQVRV